MFKLLSRLFSSSASTAVDLKDTANHAQLDELARQGLFKPQYVIPIQLQGHPLLQLLQSSGLFDLTSTDNQLMLPTDRELARRLNLSRYAETPLAAYLDGTSTQLDRIWAAAKANGANAGDDIALDSAAEQVSHLQATLKAALINGDISVAN